MSSSTRRVARWIGAWVILVAAGHQATYAGSYTPQIRQSTHYTFLYLGGFETAETATALDRSTDAGVFGAGWGWRFHRLLSLEVDANMSSTEYELPDSVARDQLRDPTLTLSTSGVLGKVKLGRPTGRVRPQVGVGLGVGLIDVSLSDRESYAIPEILESEFAVLTEVSAGIDIRVSRRSWLGIEYRGLLAHRDITFGGEKIDGGGESLVLAYRLEL